MLGRLAEVTMPTASSESLVETIKEMLSGIFSLENLTPIIIGALALGGTFVLFWFAYRFISRKVQKSMKKGSL